MGQAMSSPFSALLAAEPLHSVTFGQPKQYRDSPLHLLSCSTAPTLYAFRRGLRSQIA
jgi:hypothetical protein